MPANKVRKATDSDAAAAKATASKARVKRREAEVAKREERVRVAKPASRRWVPYVFITVGLLGVAWLVVYYIAGNMIAPMAKLGLWNLGIGMGLLAAAFMIATLWE